MTDHKWELGVITSFSEPQEMRMHQGYYLRVSLRIGESIENPEGQTVVSYLTGYMQSIMALYAARTFFIGKKVKYKVREWHPHEDTVAYAYDVDWSLRT